VTDRLGERERDDLDAFVRHLARRVTRRAMRRVRAPGREDGRGARREEATADEAAGLKSLEFRPREVEIRGGSI